ncbi:hypothetical protein QQF64_002988 [Cirrhinus molitorella]|uniref:Uncharacterized protein n=1 Tax=Cirrhinus molitorella TaxID=172907 RepID=A0ABR3MKA4_9TELE
MGLPESRRAVTLKSEAVVGESLDRDFTANLWRKRYLNHEQELCVFALRAGEPDAAVKLFGRKSVADSRDFKLTS